MKASEFIVEAAVLSADVADALPTTFVMPELKNQDPYLQYRFGVAMAAANANKELGVEYKAQDAFGEQMVVVARVPEEEEIVQLALKLIGKSNSSRVISTKASEETSDVNKTSLAIQYKKPNQ